MAKADLYRLQGIAVETGWPRGMGARGWSLSHPVEDGLIWSVERDVVLRDGRVGLARHGRHPVPADASEVGGGHRRRPGCERTGTDTDR